MTAPTPQLAPDQREVLLALASWNDDCRPYVRTIARDCALPVERVRQIIRTFDSYGWVTYGQVWYDDTGMAAGSTWWLTETGLAAKQAQESGMPMPAILRQERRLELSRQATEKAA